MTTRAESAGRPLTGLLRPHRLGLTAVLLLQIVSALGASPRSSPSSSWGVRCCCPARWTKTMYGRS
ncbi:hypothetical protein [Streptomyces scabiei]|uniref:hypothetical protein n=1 Tax=Streptomyces scabiei TaxID=1930 RepID=UPI001FF4F04A|nr:hypothetical protein [Streptomyces sp. LBUM 1486]